MLGDEQAIVSMGDGHIGRGELGDELREVTIGGEVGDGHSINVPTTRTRGTIMRHERELTR